MDSKIRKNNYHGESSGNMGTAGKPSAKKRLAVLAVLCVTAIPAAAQSPYIHRVYDFRPAPGQFVNTMPEYEPGDTQEDMNRKVEETIAGEHHNEGLISLGGYGGYVVFGFDHEVQNLPGMYDFRILGNAFYADANPKGEASREGGSCEPGIVMVSRDANGNGLPDDPWYELAGSDYHRPTTVRNYRITYTRPDEGKAPVPHPVERHVCDMEYVRWTTNGHGSGYLYRNDYHSQPYFPLWIAGETLTFEGTKLADNAVDESGQGVYYVLYASHWGYADNQPNTDRRSGFSIEWAVDAGGTPVSLPGVHFVKVYTAVNQNCGWIGEASTEIGGAEDLHLAGADTATPVFVRGVTLNRTSAELHAGETLALAATLEPANASNPALTWRSSAPDVATVSAGTVTALREGEATVEAIANDGYYVAACRITVRSTPDEPEPVPEPGVVHVAGLTLSPAEIAMQPGGMHRLEASVVPADADNPGLQWTTSDPGIAQVTVNGLVLAGYPGTATITATTDEGGYTATCLVHVRTATATGQAPTASPQVRYSAGMLHLLHLEGYHCTLFTAGGRQIATFRPASADERKPCRLAPGIYILTAQKQGKRIHFHLPAR